MVMSAEGGRYAYRKGLFVLAQSGEMMEIRNGEGFVPAQSLPTEGPISV